MFNRLRVFAGGGYLGLSLVVLGAPPSLEFLYPPGGQVGTRVEVQAGSKLEPWPMDIWADDAGLKFEAQEGKGAFHVIIDKDVTPGPHLLRLMNSNGVSNAKWFVVGTDAEVVEVEDNDHWNQAQVLTNLPVVVNGWLAKQGDVDVFAVDLSSNQVLKVEANAYGIDAGIDPMMYLLDAQGQRIMHVHDTRALDPVLVYQAEKAGRYYVQMAGFKHPPSADIRFYGAASVRYRLRFSLGETSAGLEFPPADNLVKEPEQLSFPMTVSGSLDQAREEDLYRFDVKKGEHYVFTPIAETVGSALDPYLSIRDKDDRVLVKVDDTKAQKKDAPLAWTATKDGVMRLGVRDALYRHGPEFVYQVRAAVGSPRVRASTESDVLLVEAGKSVELTLQVDRVFGDQRTWVAVAHDLPAGIQATSTELSEKGGAIKLEIRADELAKPGNSQIRVALSALDPDQPMVVPVVVKLKGQTTPHEDVDPNTVDHIWLTVQQAPSK